MTEQSFECGCNRNDSTEVHVIIQVLHNPHKWLFSATMLAQYMLIEIYYKII